MPKPFDAASKSIVEGYPESWLALIWPDSGLPLDVVDADVSTVTSAADKVLRIGGSEPWLAHFELQAARDPRLVRRMLRYNVLLDTRHDLPVESVAVLLQPRADGSELTGVLERRTPRQRRPIRFEYEVIRVWELPVETFLTGGIGVLPLAPLADVTEQELPGVLGRIGERLRDEATRAEAEIIWSTTEVLAGLKYSKGTIIPLIERISDMIFGIHGIEESSTYQAILAEGEARGEAKGEAKEARKILLRRGRRFFGEPDPKVVSAIESVTDPEKLEALIDAIDNVSNWNELITDARD
jgi:predicted transposase YdaD